MTLHVATEPAVQPLTEAARLRAVGISKEFPGVRALDRVDFDVRPGEVHGLCGENGAGKSTLMKVLAGLYQPDAGTILLDGAEVRLASPLDAKERGIVLIHQELSVVPDLSVAENIYLGNLPLKAFGRVDWAKLHADATRVLGVLGCDFGARDIVGRLSIARQQQVEIARSIALESSIVIFDEPTTSITQKEADNLFAAIRSLAARGTAIVYISHKMKEILTVTDRVTVLRDGRVTGTIATESADEDDITRLMIGRSLDQYFVRAVYRKRDELLRVDGLAVRGRVEDVSFHIDEGEIVGLYGLVGAGRTEIAEAIFGAIPHSSGTIRWQGRPVTIGSVDDAIRVGIGLVPEERKRQGLVLGLSGRDNVTLAQIDRLSRFGLVRRGAEQSIFETYRKRLRINTPGPLQPVLTLSGGNQQKIVIAKWLSLGPKLLILDEPTRGIDVGAKAEIHALIAGLAQAGLAVLVISSEMPEIMGIAHRILTVAQGRITDEIGFADFSEDRLIAGATGRVAADAAVATH